MTPTQRQAAFDRFLTETARSHARRLGVEYAGTLRKLPPPPLPGEIPAGTRFFLNAVAADGSRTGLVELTGPAAASLSRAESWALTGKGRPPPLAKPGRSKRVKT
jgi:hypothetical protein